MKLLVVEDDDSICDILEMYLCTDRIGDFKCDTAHTVQEAMEYLEHNRPDVILLDILLFGDFSTPLIAIARDWYRDNPPIIIVMSAMTGGKDWATRNAADYFISKPFDLEILEDLIFSKCQKRIDEFPNLR